MLPLSEIERRIILGALARLGGDKPRAALALGISLKTLYNKLERYGVRPVKRRRSRGGPWPRES